MTYTSNDLARLSGYTLSRVSYLLRGMGYSPVDVIENNQNVWAEETLQALIDKRDNVNADKGTSIGYLATKFNVNNQTIREILESMDIEPMYIDNKQQEYYEKKTLDILTDYFDTGKSEEEDSHPLVTDKRCLQVSWFPDIVPKCFEDLDED